VNEERLDEIRVRQSRRDHGLRLGLEKTGERLGPLPRENDITKQILTSIS